MKKRSFTECFQSSKFILTEAAVGQRIEREFKIKPDRDIFYAGMIYEEHSRKALETIYRQYLKTAEDFSLPTLLLTNTRRANRERMERSAFAHRDVMRDYTEFLRGLASEYSCEAYVGGMMGCRGDAYRGDEGLSTEEAIAFHSWQAGLLRDARPDFIYAALMPCLPEAIGMARALEPLGLPTIMSLMIRRNGRLLDSSTIHEAICEIDGAVEHKPLCYMTNCVHPAILREALSQRENRTDAVRERFMGIQANAACLDPDVLDDSPELKTSPPEELTLRFLELHGGFPMKICGGCCGTDDSHLRSLAAALRAMS